VKYKGDKRTVIDGPFTEAKEVIGGYWIIQVRSKEEAVEWARRVSARVRRWAPRFTHLSAVEMWVESEFEIEVACGAY